MTYVPLFWLIASLLLVPYRPGFLLGCAILAFQYDNLYNTTMMGPSLFVLFFSIMVLIAFVQRRSFVLNISDYLILSFGSLYVLAMLYSPDISAGIRISGRLVLLGMGYYFIGRFLSSNNIYRSQYIYDFGISILILSLAFGYLSVGLQESSARLLLGEGSAVGFSQMIDISAGFCLFYLLSVSGNHAWIKRFAMYIIFAGIMVLLLFNATRGTVVSLVFAVCVYFGVSVLQWKPGNRIFKRMLSLGFVIFGASVVLLQFSGQSEVLVFGLERLGMNFGPSGVRDDTSLMVRFELFRMAWDMFVQAPLFGHGIGSFLWNGKLYYPHNVFLELLAETGLMATTVFTIIFVRVGWMAFRLFRKNIPEVTIAGGIFLITAAHQQMSFALWMAKAMFLFMGVVVSYHIQLERPQPKSRPQPLSVIAQRSARLARNPLPDEQTN